MMLFRSIANRHSGHAFRVLFRWGSMVRTRTPEALTMRRSLRRIPVHARPLTLAAGALAAPAALAQQPPAGDLLDQARRMQVIAAQQIESEVRLGLVDVTRLATTDRPKA